MVGKFYKKYFCCEKIKGFNKRDAFGVDAIIISENLSLWSVKLDIAYDMKKFKFDKY